jgi:hypothetical protein
VIAACAVALLTAACQAGDTDVVPPASNAGCNHLYTEGDPGLGVGFDYDESVHHRYGTAVPLMMCASFGSVEITGTSPQIVVDPGSLDGPGPEYRFTVTVTEGATGGIHVDAFATFDGPAIVADGTGWSFGPWGDLP